MAILPVSLVTAAVVFMAPTSVHLSITSLDQTHANFAGHTNMIAQKYGAEDPHGDDPHGGDPHDEVHDDGMKANEDQKASKAPKDVYGGKYDNSQNPY
ncbi:MAG TPA: hypothetical protein V6C69_22290 [Trichormus sp.]|jgi:hypothetical protein